MAEQPLVHVIDDDEAVPQTIEFLLKTVGITGRSFESARAFFEGPPGNAGGCIIPDGTVIGENLVDDAKRFHVTPNGVVLVCPEMLGQEIYHVR